MTNSFDPKLGSSSGHDKKTGNINRNYKCKLGDMSLLRRKYIKIVFKMYK